MGASSNAPEQNQKASQQIEQQRQAAQQQLEAYFASHPSPVMGMQAPIAPQQFSGVQGGGVAGPGGIAYPQQPQTPNQMRRTPAGPPANGPTPIYSSDVAPGTRGSWGVDARTGQPKFFPDPNGSHVYEYQYSQPWPGFDSTGHPTGQQNAAKPNAPPQPAPFQGTPPPVPPTAVGLLGLLHPRNSQ